MFTSRARMVHLRSDNADRRLAPLAAACGLIDADRAARVAAKQTAIEAVVSQVSDKVGVGLLVRSPRLCDTAEVPGLATLEPDAAESAWIDLRYHGYLERHHCPS